MATSKTASRSSVVRKDDAKEKAAVRLRLQGYSPARISELLSWPEMVVKYVLRKRNLC